MYNGIVYTVKTIPSIVSATTLGQIAENNVDEHFYLNDAEKEMRNYLHGIMTQFSLNKQSQRFIKFRMCYNK